MAYDPMTSGIPALSNAQDAALPTFLPDFGAPSDIDSLRDRLQDLWDRVAIIIANAQGTEYRQPERFVWETLERLNLFRMTHGSVLPTPEAIGHLHGDYSQEDLPLRPLVWDGENWVNFHVSGLPDERMLDVILRPVMVAIAAMNPPAVQAVNALRTELRGDVATERNTMEKLSDALDAMQATLNTIGDDVSGLASELPAANLVGMVPVSSIPPGVRAQPQVSSGGIADLTSEQQANIGEGSPVLLSDGRVLYYRGTGSKTLEASYVVGADQSPAEAQIPPLPISKTTGLQAALDGKQRVPVSTYADLTAMPASGRSDNMVVNVISRSALGDGGHGNWIFKATSTATPDSGMVLRPDDVGPSDPGRWIRMDSGPIDPRWFAAKGDGSTDNASAFSAMAGSAATAGRAIRFPEGEFLSSAAMPFSGRGVYLIGAGERLTILRFSNSDGITHAGDFTLNIKDIGIETSVNGTRKGVSYGLSAPVYTLDAVRLTNVNFWGTVYGTNYWSVAVHARDCSNTWFDRVTVIGMKNSAPGFGGKGFLINSSTAKPSTGHHFNRCTLDWLDVSAEIYANHNPSIEGVRFHMCGFVGVNHAIIFDASASGYQPPLFSMTECHVDLAANATNPIGIYLNSVSQIHIVDNDLYSFVANGVLIQLNNTSVAKVQGNTFIGGSFAGMYGMLLESGATHTKISKNTFAGPFAIGIYNTSTSGAYNHENDNTYIGVTDDVTDAVGNLVRLGKSKVRVKRTAVQSVPNATPTSLAWQAADENLGGGWLVANPSRMTVAQGVTSVRLDGTVRFEANATGYRQVLVKKNGAWAQGLPIITAVPISGQPTDISISTGVLDVVPGDYFEIEVTQTSGGSLNVDNAVTYGIMSVLQAA